VEKRVGDKVDMKHFTPKYNPWDQRLCAVPNGDLFKRLREGKASVVTDTIERFTETGIRLSSGQELDADIIITATGLQVQLLGGMTASLDGQSIDPSKKLYYKGAMVEDIPNFAMVFGYTNSSWTLKADLICEYFCRVINEMDRLGATQCTPRNHDRAMEREPFLDLSSGYIQRALAQLPQQGKRKPWRLYQNYLQDMASLRFSSLKDDVLVFSNPVTHGYGYGLENTAGVVS
jgi:cation diffusion facilitator CzcD-associated flavoprotein CzcO